MTQQTSKRVVGYCRVSTDKQADGGVSLDAETEKIRQYAALYDLDLVAVGTGPGSYTGLRVGVTAARGLAYAAHRPLLGVPSCDAWARATPVREATLAVVLDSRTKEVYLAVYRAHGDEWRRDGEPTVLDPGTASSRIPDDAVLVGDGAAAYPQQLGEHRHLDSPNRAEATDVARLALERHGRGERQKVDDVVRRTPEGPAPYGFQALGGARIRAQTGRRTPTTWRLQPHRPCRDHPWPRDSGQRRHGQGAGPRTRPFQVLYRWST